MNVLPPLSQETWKAAIAAATRALKSLEARKTPFGYYFAAQLRLKIATYEKELK